MTPVPYTRAAVQRIRDGASAADLGWPTSRYERVCRDHGIQARVNHKPAAQGEVVTATEHDVLHFDSRTGEIFYHGIVVALAPVQAKIFGVLFGAYAAGISDLIPASRIHDMTASQSDQSAIATAISQINARIRPLRISIIAKKGNGGGFRLRVPDSPSPQDESVER